MGFGDATATQLFLSRRRSDLEFEVQGILERKMAILDQCNEISAILSNEVFNTGDMHSSITSGNAVEPGAVYPVIPGVSVTTSPWGTVGTSGATESYELLLAELQHKEKELDVKNKKLQTELEAVKAEEESVKKMAVDHAKKDFKIG